MKWMFHHRPATAFLSILLLLLIVQLGDCGWRRRRRRSPPPCPYRCTVKNPPINTNPQGLASSGVGVCRVTEYRSEQYCTPCHCGSCPAYRAQAISVLRCCGGYRQSGNTCPIKIPCGSPRDIPYGSKSPNKASYAVGEKVTYRCNTHYRLNRNGVITCLLGPRWSAAIPDCVPIPCTNPPIPPHSAISGGARGSYNVGVSVTMVCVSGYRLVSGSVTRTCQVGNRWTGSNVVCKPVCYGNVDVCKNGGVCTSPNFCSNCKDGYYSPKCDPCPKITNCAFSVCSHPDPNGSKRCRTCSYDFGHEKGRAYEPSADGKTCLKRCSWRSDSNVCYPGTCGLVSTCKCAIGFASPSSQCTQITEHPRINPGFLRVYYGGGMTGQDQRINVTKSMEGGGKLFTNAPIITKVAVSISANYLKNLPQAPPFIIRKSIGLDSFQLDFKLYHSTGTKTLLSLSPSMREASGMFKAVHQVDQQVDISKKCASGPCQLNTNDRFRFVTRTKNGGFITVRNPEVNKDSTRTMTGKFSERVIEISVDRDPPQHCSKSSSRCGEPLVLQPAGFITSTSVSVRWPGWSDAVAGLSVTHVSVSEMQLGADGKLDVAHGGAHMHHWATEVPAPTTETTVSLPAGKTAVYEVKAVVCDNVIERLKNCQATRRFILRDAGTAVTTTSAPIQAVGQVANGDARWKREPGTAVTLRWTGHFENTLYRTKGFLNAIRGWPISGEDRFYDHLRGPRNISQIRNVLGIVRFRSQMKMRRHGTSTFGNVDPKAWREEGQALVKTYSYPLLTYVDGDSARFWIEAWDVVGHRKVDSFTLNFDSSPATIGNISLIRDGRPGSNVHHAKELFKMKFRLNIRDPHSGVFTIKWRLYDNYTRTELVHGSSDVGRQRYSTMAECRAAHPSSACYSTDMWGVFADLFEVELNKGNILHGKELTQHDHDLQMKFTVQNNALLQSEKTFQISIDVSGPLPGHVFDGVVGSPEVNFQNSLKVRGHWKDFYDKESGIAFYKYKFGPRCYTDKDFSLTNKRDETLNDFASWTAPGPGRYHLTVVAYNHALQPSVPVCSNGLVIDSSPPVVSSVAVEGLRTRPGLLTDSESRLWLVDAQRRRRQIVNTTSACLRAAASLPSAQVALLPLLTDPLHRRPLAPKTLSDSECAALGSFSNASVLPSDVQLNISFAAADPESGVEEVFAALVMAADDGGVGDGKEWLPARGMNSILMRHPDIRHGARVFLKLRATDRAQLSTVETVGPITVNVRPPAVTGALTVRRKENKVSLSWSSTAIVDSVTPFPLQLSLSAGRSDGAADLIRRQSIASYPRCPGNDRCIVVDMSSVDIAGGKNIFFRLHAANVARHSSVLKSLPFPWTSFSGAAGVIRIVEINQTILKPQLTSPITCQSNKTAVRVVWFGFRISTAVTLGSVVIIDRSTKVSLKRQTVDFRSGEATVSGLALKDDKEYSAQLTVTTPLGSVSATSSPIRILRANRVFSDVKVVIGDVCPSTDTCDSDIMQASTSHVYIRWSAASGLSSLHPLVLLTLELHNAAGSWDQVATRSISSTTQTNFTFTGLSLLSGTEVRAIVRLSVDSVVSAPHMSQRLWVSQDQPIPGSLQAQLSRPNAVEFCVGKFGLRGFDKEQHGTYMAGYEWRLQAGKKGQTEDMNWQSLPLTDSNKTHICGSISLPANVSSSKCVEFAVRGRTRAGLVAVVSRRIGSCATGPDAVRPNTVIDAKGPLTLGSSFDWPLPDIDYLVEDGLLAAVWPRLRHGRFRWAILESQWSFSGGFFVTEKTRLTSPCDHKNAILCGTTDKRYMSLAKGSVTPRVDKRYHVCIHANRTVRGSGSGREVLDAVSACSDGVKVLSKVPRPGSVRAGPAWQSSSSQLTISWRNFFSDSASLSPTPLSVVKEYFYKVGTTAKGDDVIRYTSAGLSHQMTVSGLTMENKAKYYVTVKAVSLVGVEAESSAPAVGIDLQSPQISDSKRFRIENSHEEYLTDVTMTKLRWDGLFVDHESGLCSYQWCIGSGEGLCDVQKPKTTTQLQVSDNLDSVLLDGNAYFFGVRAFDCVGHSKLYTSPAYYVIKSGPQPGQVLDGERGPDIDYQMHTDSLSAHWTDFEDKFTDIVEYKVHVGSFRGGADVIKDVSVGLHTSVTFDHLELRVGVRYQFGVTACNRAKLCTTAVSDGLLIDQTPPILGRVLDGAKDYTMLYQHSSSSVEFRLTGFADLESGLSTLDWCLTRSSTECDVSPIVTIPFENMVRSQLRSPIPSGVLIRILVVVHNHVGMNTTALSNGFTVDPSPPVFSRRAEFDLSQQSIVVGTQVAATRLAVSWKVSDAQSGIWEQFVSVTAHASSAEVAKTARLPGFSIGSLVLAKLALRDGYRYKAEVTSCNRAGRCSRSTTQKELLVDNSPPQVGMFLPRTNASHIHDGVRNMTWTSRQVTLTWQGFSDAHSGVTAYVVTVGTKYMSDDLLQARTVSHVARKREQLNTFSLSKPISAGSTVFIALRAVNGVGLKSHILHIAVVASADGNLDVVRRCTAVNCLGHCVCAPLHHSCAPTGSCTDLTGKSGSHPTVSVADVTSLSRSNDVDFTTEQCAYSAVWTSSKSTGIRRYEVSAGLANSNTPKGLFDEHSERVWFDVGQETKAVLNLTHRSDKCMKQNVKYKFFVRAWYDSKTFAVFTSDGMTPLVDLPQVRRQKGSRLSESNPSTPSREIDVISSGLNQLLVQWRQQFSERLPGTINSFSVSIGTICGGTDLAPLVKLDSTKRSHLFTGLEFVHGRRYVSSVLTCDINGLCSLACSDGAIADFTKPLGGIVVNSMTGLSNTRYQSNTTHVSTSWKEFTDPETSISSYGWCLGATSTPSDCSHVAWQDMGLHSHTRRSVAVSKPLNHGDKLFARVRAQNGVGAAGSVTVSGQSIIVDTVAPYLIGDCHRSDAFVIKNNIFTNFKGSAVAQRDLKPSWFRTTTSTLDDWTLGPSSAAQVVRSTFSHRGATFALVRGGIKQQVATTVGRVYAVTFQVSDVNNWSRRTTKWGYVNLGEVTKHSFVVQAKKATDAHLTWVEKHYYFKATSTATTLEIGALGSDVEGLGFDSVIIKACSSKASTTGSSSLRVSVEQVDEHVRVHASWAAHDDLSGLTRTLWALGTVRGGVQQQAYTSVGARNSIVQTPLIRVPHATPLHFTLLLVDKAGAASVHHAFPVVTDFRPPNVVFKMTDRRCTDACVVPSGRFKMTVEAVDEESGISKCSVALGRSPRAEDVQSYRTLTPDSGKRYLSTEVQFDTEPVNGKIVFPTVVCVNGRGVSTTVALQQGVRLVLQPPSATTAFVRLLTPSSTFYPRSGSYQSEQSQVVFMWGKFTDSSGADFYYEYSLVGPTGSPYRAGWRRLADSQTRMVLLEGLTLADRASYTLSVRAVNEAHLYSFPVSMNVTIDSRRPTATSEPLTVATVAPTKWTLDWGAVFTNFSPLFYEVAIGSGRGKADIFGLVETRKTTMTLDGVDPLRKYHLSVTAVSSSGLYTQVLFEIRAGKAVKE